MTNTLVRPAQIIFEEPEPKRRYRLAAVAVAVVSAGVVALGVASLNDSPAQWAFPTTVEELVDSGLVPVESLGNIAVEATKWAIPTSIDDLIGSGFDPTS